VTIEFRFGIEEEFFVVNEESQLLEPTTHEQFLATAKKLSDGAVTRELLQSQVETATPVCTSLGEARDHVLRLRSALAEAGRRTGLSVIAAGTHPTAEWLDQQQTSKKRYDDVMDELQILGRRNLVCGMHAHVEMPEERRVDVMRRAIPFLPILLGLSCSSPFWRGMSTGFSSYRLTSYEELPRTGLPPLFADAAEYEAYVGVLQRAKVIRDSSFIWWAIRLSHKYPTLELRIPDSCTSVEDTLTIAALYRCLMRLLIKDRGINAHLGPSERALAKENKWRVQRYGAEATLIDPLGESEAIAFPRLARRFADLLLPHAEALDCVAEVKGGVERILERGTSAENQLRIYEQAIAEGLESRAALGRVKTWLQQETLAVCQRGRDFAHRRGTCAAGSPTSESRSTLRSSSPRRSRA
jgi:glutamate---cysteine ligase / carboxylate-amine ligase